MIHHRAELLLAYPVLSPYRTTYNLYVTVLNCLWEVAIYNTSYIHPTYIHPWISSI